MSRLAFSWGGNNPAVTWKCHDQVVAPTSERTKVSYNKTLPERGAPNHRKVDPVDSKLENVT